MGRWYYTHLHSASCYSTDGARTVRRVNKVLQSLAFPQEVVRSPQQRKYTRRRAGEAWRAAGEVGRGSEGGVGGDFRLADMFRV